MKNSKLTPELIERYSHKIKSAEEIASLIGSKPRTKSVIMCHGTFDVVHPGHVRHLVYASSKADLLIASLTADKHITKSNHRPYVPETLRALNLAALEMVDYVLIDINATPLENLKVIKPDYFAKGYEYTAGEVHPKTKEEIDVLASFGGKIIFTPGDIVYSSSTIIESSPPSLEVDKLLLIMSSEGISFQDLRDCLKKMQGRRVLVVGDTIVDSYTYCSMIGGMTKTPTMSVRFERKVDYVGGAAVVSKHLRAAGASVNYVTILGEDSYKDFVLNDLEHAGVECSAIVEEKRPTTNKNAIVAADYRLLKVDTVDNRSITDSTLARICEDISKADAEAVVFSDFRHGIFNRDTIPVLTKAIPEGRTRVADSQVASRWGNILEFQGFDLITPNEREARFSLGDQDSVIRPLATKLFARAHCKNLILKCGDKGMIACRDKYPEDDPRAFFVLDSFAQNVLDAVGAGDALLAYATLAHVAVGNEVIAAILGSIAAGIECEFDGNHPVTPNLVMDKLATLEKLANFG